MAASVPSTITRRAGSVPDGRTRTRPPGPSRALGSRIARLEDGIALPLVLMTGRDRPLLLRQQRDPRRQVGAATRCSRAITRRTSSAVTIPSPDVVCSRTMTWPLFSPPSDGARDLHPLEDVLVADRGPDDLPAGRLDDRLEPAVREDRHDEAAVRQHAPREPVEGEDAEHLVAVDDVARSRRPR